MSTPTPNPQSPDPAAPVEGVIDEISDLETVAHRQPEATVADVQQQVDPLADHIETANIADLLEGDFETLADILGDVFEEHALVVEDAADAAAVSSSGPGESPTPSVEPAGGETAPPPSVIVESSTPPAEPVAARPDVAADTEPEPPTPEPPPEIPVASEPVVSSSPRLGTLVGASAVGLLVHINRPLRMVPAGMRGMVNWVALTLLLWVPVVWVIVLLS